MSYFTVTKIKNFIGNIINPATEEKQDALNSKIDTSNNSLASIAAATQLMTVVKAIDQSSFNLNAAPYSGTTNISSDYILDNIELTFSTSQSRTITITTSSGAVIYSETNTVTTVIIPSGNGYHANENITVAVTQTGGACLLGVKVRIRTGSVPVVGTLPQTSSAIRITSDSTYTYIGTAAPGASTSSSVWKIFRIDSTGNTTWANGSAAYSNKWTDVLTLSYS